MNESFQWRAKILAAEEKYFEERRKFYDSQLSEKPLEKILENSEISSASVITSDFEVTNDGYMISGSDFNKAVIEDSAATSDASQISNVSGDFKEFQNFSHQSDITEFNKDLHMLADYESSTSIVNWTMLSRNRDVRETESMIERNFQRDLHMTHLLEKISKNSKLDENAMKRDYKHKKINKCTLCTEIFSSYRELVRHFRTHKNFKKFSCDQCTADFFSKAGFHKHLKSHMENRPSLNKKSFICEFKDCGKVFFTKCFYTAHRVTHHKEKEDIEK